jgi:FKBP-type peptidyl-prolyl cis-trans isomerase FkpA
MTRISSLLLCALSAGALASFDAMAATPAPTAAPAAAAAAPKAAKPAAGQMSEADKTAYAIGVILSGSVKPFALTDHEMQLVRDGFDAGLHGKSNGVDAESMRPQIQALLAERMGKEVAAAKSSGQAYRDKAAKAPDTTTLPSGVIITKVKAGSGPSPKGEDQVKVNYEGRLIDGTVFDASAQHGQPLTFKVSGVVPCWSEALQTMSVGEKVKLVCPPEQAYGDRGSPPKIPGGSTLVFDVELLAIEKAPEAAAAPAAPAEPAKPDASQR